MGLCLFAMAPLVGCGVFEPRDAQAPTAEGTSWVVPDFPEKVFQNLKSGLEDGTGVNYERSLHTLFTFIPLDEDANQIGPDKYLNWTRDVETQVMQRMLAEASKVEVEFVTPILEEGSPTDAKFRAKYELKITDRAQPPVTTEYQGTAFFDFKKTVQWELIQWQDIEFEAGFASWGFLRGTLRQ